MSESDNQSEKGKKSFTGIILLLLAIVVGVAGFNLYQKQQGVADGVVTQIGDDVSEMADKGKDMMDSAVASASEAVDTMKDKTENAVETVKEESEDVSEAMTDKTDSIINSITSDLNGNVSGFDLEKAKTPRILGNPDAPVKISEHSSFTCSHCGAFHETNFKNIKRDYIDTGKAYMVFDDFARNYVDLGIGVLSRCVPEDKYFDYIQLMFETQEDWHPNMEKYEGYARQNALMTGASKEDLDACFNSEELRMAMADRVKMAQENHGVSGTPTLVINGKSVVSGLTPYPELKKLLDTAYVESTK